MTWPQYSKLMLSKLDQLGDIDQVALTAVNNVYRQQLTRVFVDGRNSAGGPIGSYSPKYREFKQKKIGTGSKVDLVLSSQFRAAFGLDANSKQIEIGFFNTVRKTLSGGTASVKNSEIRAESENRYGEIFAMTDQEYSDSIKAINARINRILNE